MSARLETASLTTNVGASLNLLKEEHAMIFRGIGLKVFVVGATLEKKFCRLFNTLKLEKIESKLEETKTNSSKPTSFINLH